MFFLLILIASCSSQNNGKIKGSEHPKSDAIGTKHEKVFKSQPTKNGDAENVRCGILDQNGNLWFGTTGHGVFRYDGTSFTLYTTNDGLGGNRVVALCEDKAGNILLGTNKGLYYYDGKSIGEYLKNKQLENRSISALYMDSKERIWIGTHYSGLFIYDGKNLTSVQSDDKVVNEFNLALNGICDIMEDSSGDFWLTSWAIADEGVIKLGGDSLLQLSKIHKLPDSLFYSVLEYPDGKYWFGSRKNGLFNFEKGEFSKSNYEPVNDSGVVGDMRVDKNGLVWFATDFGVFRYDPSLKSDEKNAYQHFTTEEGLINNSVYCVVEDQLGNLWFGTNNVGLSRYDGKSFVDFSE